MKSELDKGMRLGYGGNSEVACHSQSPFFPLSARAPLASHAIEGSNDKEQETHADGHGHDSHSSLGGLGSHCRDKTDEQGSASSALSAPCLAPVAPPWLLTRAKVKDVLGGPVRVGGLTEDTFLAQGTGHLQRQRAAHPALPSGSWLYWLRRLESGPGPWDQGLGVRAEVVSSPPGSRRGDTMLGEGAGSPGCLGRVPGSQSVQTG